MAVTVQIFKGHNVHILTDLHGEELRSLLADRDWLHCVFISDGAGQALVSSLICPPGLECLLDSGQLVTHMGNLRHDYS